MLKKVDISELKPGMFITSVIKQHGPVKIRKVGIVKSEAMVSGLREMGVDAVEIDTEQSLEVIEHKQGQTPTARLLANDKKVEEVDRELSQQFHNSLFMPAVEEMPSRWHLYAKHYTFFGLFIISGFVLGFSAMQIPYLLDNIQQSPVIAHQQSDTPSIAAKPENVAPLPESDTQNKAPTGIETKDNEQFPLKADRSNIVEADEQSATEQILSAQLIVEDSIELPNPNPLPEVQGIELTEGQQVLGYQAEEINPQITSQTTNDEINPELLARISEVVDALADEPDSSGVETTEETTFLRVDQISPNLQNALPGMSFSAHMFASNPQDRWVRVNGRRLAEGDYINNDLLIHEITADKVVLNFRGQRFTMNALSDWQ